MLLIDQHKYVTVWVNWEYGIIIIAICTHYTAKVVCNGVKRWNNRKMHTLLKYLPSYYDINNFVYNQCYYV